METRIYRRRNRIRSAAFIIGAVIVTGCGDVRSGQPEASLDRPESSEAGQPETSLDWLESSEAGQPETSLDWLESSEAGQPDTPHDRRESSGAGQHGTEAEHISQEQIIRCVPALPATGRTLPDFVAEGWELIDSVELDYNEDGVTDYVGVQEASDGEWAGLRILFGVVSEGAGQYRLDFQDENLIRTREEGGVFGDPYEPLTAKGTSFTTHAYGGSAWKWSEAYTYTYRDGTWYLIRSEDSYGYGPYITDYVINDWDSGVYTRTMRSSEFNDMEKHWGDYEGMEDDGEYDLAYEMKLDEPITLFQAGKRWWLAPNRVTDWGVQRIVLAEGIELSQEMIRTPETAYLYDYCDENCVVYDFSRQVQENDWRYYLAMYRWQDKSLTVLAEEDTDIDDEIIYENRIYYSTEVVKHIAYKAVENGEEIVREEDDVIGVRLNRINMDGTGKETVFEYLCPGTDQQILEGRPPYMGLIPYFSGGEIVIEVYVGDSVHPVYRMNVDGSDLRQIGQIPK